METSLKMLIIDDNEEILSALSDYFSNKNYSITSASNGLDGLKLLEAEKQGFDVVLTDLVMPNISGVGIITIVKKKYPDTLVIAITGWGEHPEALASEAQADRVLRKPIKLNQLDKILTELLAKRGKQPAK